LSRANMRYEASAASESPSASNLTR
jgi:hypothetical protein